MNEDEVAIVRRAKNGDVNALGELVERFRGRVYALAVSIAGTGEGARAIAREAFTRAWRELAALEEPRRFPAWLAGIALAAGHELERSGRLPRGTDEPPDDPDRALVFAFLAALPEEQRVAIDLRFREDLSYAEIAETLGTRPASVRSLLSQALATLREKLAPVIRKRVEAT